MRNFFEHMSLSGAVIVIFTILTLVGIGMSACGNPEGEKVWNMFGTALTTFVSGKKVAEYELNKKQ